MARRPGASVFAAVLLGCAGCASIDVRRMATDSTPAYELRGPTLQGLSDEAAALCPHGFNTIQQWERRQETPPEANVVARWTGETSRWVGLGGGSASMTVHCKA